jgi:tRNA-dihydrouridine synthase A
MKKTTSIDVTIKCRIGVDDQDPQEILPDFLSHLSNAGISRVIIHARKAILKGLSPKENRNVPPLNYALVLKMKENFPNLHISINGGIKSLKEANNLLSMGLDGVMIGRSAYQQPAQILSNVDSMIFEDGTSKSPLDVANEMRFYIKRHCESGGKLHQVTRHMMGLFHGLPGAKIWRQKLSSISITDSLDFYDEVLTTVSNEIKTAAA